jgi:hypothetical protein
MVGLVLGVVTFPEVMNIETLISITAGTKLGVSTLGAITAALRHDRHVNLADKLMYVFLYYSKSSQLLQPKSSQ